MEVNFDGLVGPTHQYGGLSFGNIASESNRNTLAHPKEAALQGLLKMSFLASLNLTQGVLPPQERPDIHTLRTLGFNGSDAEILAAVHKEDPKLLTLCSSASSMWTANAATVSPSVDSRDGKVHFTPANLVSNFHRSLEPATTSKILRKIFNNEHHFVHHDVLPATNLFADEGAANHTRFCKNFDGPGVQLFVYGRDYFKGDTLKPIHYPARQSFEASRAVARRHLIADDQVVFAQQNPKAIDLGVFHNDVISVGNQNVFLFHEEAFVHTDEIIKKLGKKFKIVCGEELICIPITGHDLPIKDAVACYLFNSQLITMDDGSMLLAAPEECKEMESAHRCIERMIGDRSNPIDKVVYFNLRQSMRNGGGPACLRLRVALTENEVKSINPNVLMTDSLYRELYGWIQKNYRERLTAEELVDPQLLKESRTALDELTKILKLGSIYQFQMV